MMVEVQLRRRAIASAGPVEAGGIHHQQVVAFGDLLTGVRDQPLQVAGHLLGVAEHRLRPQGAHQMYERRRGSDGVPVGPDVGRDGSLIYGL